jgi:hypothetical protein
MTRTCLVAALVCAGCYDVSSWSRNYDGAGTSDDFGGAGGDMGSASQRIVFLMGATQGILGSQSSVDGRCTTEATNAGLTGNYVALLGYDNHDPVNQVSLTSSTRLVVLPFGAPVAYEDKFFSFTSHLNPINLQSDGSVATATCVWTNFGPDGHASTTDSDCTNWTSVSATSYGVYGDPQQKGPSWANVSNTPCNTACHVYCMQLLP